MKFYYPNITGKLSVTLMATSPTHGFTFKSMRTTKSKAVEIYLCQCEISVTNFIMESPYLMKYAKKQDLAHGELSWRTGKHTENAMVARI